MSHRRSRSLDVHSLSLDDSPIPFISTPRYASNHVRANSASVSPAPPESDDYNTRHPSGGRSSSVSSKEMLQFDPSSIGASPTIPPKPRHHHDDPIPPPKPFGVGSRIARASPRAASSEQIKPVDDAKREAKEADSPAIDDGNNTATAMLHTDDDDESSNASAAPPPKHPHEEEEDESSSQPVAKAIPSSTHNKERKRSKRALRKRGKHKDAKMTIPLILFVGECDVGKRSMARALGSKASMDVASIHVVHYVVKLKSRKSQKKRRIELVMGTKDSKWFDLDPWAGRADAVVYCFSKTSAQSLEKLLDWGPMVGSAIREGIPTFLVGSKSDVRIHPSERVPYFQGCAVAQGLNVIDYWEVSARDPIGIETAFGKIADYTCANDKKREAMRHHIVPFLERIQRAADRTSLTQSNKEDDEEREEGYAPSFKPIHDGIELEVVRAMFEARLDEERRATDAKFQRMALQMKEMQAELAFLHTQCRRISHVNNSCDEEGNEEKSSDETST